MYNVNSLIEGIKMEWWKFIVYSFGWFCIGWHVGNLIGFLIGKVKIND